MAEIDELRAQPQDILAEQSVLGAIFLDESKLVFVREYIEPADFFKYANRLIFKAMIDLADRGDAIDATTVRNILDSQDDLQNIGGLSYLVEVINSVPTSANAEYYAKIVAEKAILRRLIARLTDSINQAYDGASPADEIIAGAEKALIDVSENANRSGFKNIKDILNINFENLEVRSQQTSHITGIATGYPELDKMTTGLHEEELIILAARPAVGKTAFALNIAQNIGTKLDKTVAIFSLEMSAVQLVNRLIASETELSAEKLKTGRLTDEEWQQLHSRIKALVEAPILVDDTPALSIFELRAKCRRLKQKYGIKVLIIDYLQLMTAGADMRGNREQEVSLISRQLKIIAKELSIPVMALSQLNRGVESRPDKKPMLSDLRESGSIEQDADMVMFIHRPEKYGITVDNEGNSLLGIATIIIAKHRSGAVGEVNLRFRAELTQFCDLDTTSPFASSTSTGEIVTQTFSSKMNDEPVPALDQGFEGMRDSFDNNAPF